MGTIYIDGQFKSSTKPGSEAVCDDAAIKADIAKKQDKLTAGANIAISGATISAKDTIYNDTAIKADIAKKADKIYVDTQDAKKQDKLIVGTNITISGSTISATDTIYDDTVIKADIAKKADKVDTYTKNEADNKFNMKFSSGITDIALVDVLPDEGDREDNILYLVKED